MNSLNFMSLLFQIHARCRPLFISSYVNFKLMEVLKADHNFDFCPQGSILIMCCVVLRRCWVQLSVTPGTAALQAPPSMGVSRQEYWRGLPCPPPGDLQNPGVELRSPTLQADSLPNKSTIVVISHFSLCSTPWTVPHWIPLSTGVGARPRNQSHVSCLAGGVCTIKLPGKPWVSKLAVPRH